MLTNTFCHIPGVSEKTEQKLWSAGITSWDTAWPEAGFKLPRRCRESWPSHIQESINHHANRNSAYFAANLPAKHQWRLYHDFQGSCAFVDIETTGLSWWTNTITTIAIYDGQTIRCYVNGDNLHDFPTDVMKYQVLVTYNGKQFDIPFIEHFFKIRLPQAHIDLRYPLHSLGIKGGLKGCERQLGMARPGLENVDGFLAVLLWREYQLRKNRKALETLLAYNIADTLALHSLMVHTHNAKLAPTPFADSYILPRPTFPESPFKADHDTVKSVERHMVRW